jgi:hypothetical protein
MRMDRFQERLPQLEGGTVVTFNDVRADPCRNDVKDETADHISRTLGQQSSDLLPDALDALGEDRKRRWVVIHRLSLAGFLDPGPESGLAGGQNGFRHGYASTGHGFAGAGEIAST